VIAFIPQNRRSNFFQHAVDRALAMTYPRSYHQRLSSQETVDFNKYVLFPRVVATANF